MAEDRTVASRQKKRFSLRNIISMILLVVAIGMLFYPIVVNWLVAQQNVKSIQTYNNSVKSLGTSKAEKLLADASEYNAKLYNDYIYSASQRIPWNKPIPDYNQELAVDNSGIMAYITIPQIQVKDVPIFHGDSEKVLVQGIGHIQQTSLPVGGINTHSVLPAHSGRTNNTLFTELERLKNGDVFYIHVLNKELKYRVISEKIVEPKDTSSLGIMPGKDLVTLITCWPTGINNKRLLVTGERVPVKQVALQEKVNRNMFGYNFWVMTASGLLALIGLFYLLSLLFRRRLHQAGLAPLKEPKLTDISGRDTATNPAGSFGAGFYLTNSKELAERWLDSLVKDNEALLKADENLSPVINVYKLQKLQKLSRWIFKGKTENWQKYVQDSLSPDFADNKHELIAGPVPAEDFRFGKRILQYSLKTDEAMQHLKYVKTIKRKNR